MSLHVSVVPYESSPEKPPHTSQMRLNIARGRGGKEDLLQKKRTRKPAKASLKATSPPQEMGAKEYDIRGDSEEKKASCEELFIFSTQPNTNPMSSKKPSVYNSSSANRSPKRSDGILKTKNSIDDNNNDGNTQKRVSFHATTTTNDNENNFQRNEYNATSNTDTKNPMNNTNITTSTQQTSDGRVSRMSVISPRMRRIHSTPASLLHMSSPQQPQVQPQPPQPSQPPPQPQQRDTKTITYRHVREMFPDHGAGLGAGSQSMAEVKWMLALQADQQTDTHRTKVHYLQQSATSGGHKVMGKRPVLRRKGNSMRLLHSSLQLVK